jgi:hypothetical protein
VKLDEAIEFVTPDYSIYPNIDDRTAYGFLTRGCPNRCKWCVVPRKEGGIKPYMDVEEIAVDGRNELYLMDNNILACDYGLEQIEKIIRMNEGRKKKIKVDFNQGLDCRLLTEEKIDYLNKIKIKEIHFAWDRYCDKGIILDKLKLYADNAKRRPHNHNSIVYTIVNFDTTFEQDLERIYTLRELGYWAYVMIYDKEHCDRKYKDLQRWVNNRFIFSKCEKFEQYKN